MPKSALVPQYSLHKPTGQAYVRIRGKFIYLGKYDSQASREAYGRFVAELASNPLPSPSPTIENELTVVELCAGFIDHCQQYYRKNGAPTRRIDIISRIVSIVRDLYGMTSASQFGPKALRAIQHNLIGKNQSRYYINDQVDEIKRMFKWGASMELLPVTVYQALATVPGLKRGRTEARETAPILPVDDAVVEATMPNLPLVVADMVRLQKLTGARPGEICQLRPMDVNRIGEVWEYHPASHKTEHHGKSRIIYIGPQAQAVLLPYFDRADNAYCFSPAESEEKRHQEQRAKRITRVQPSQQHRRKVKPKRAPRSSYDKNAFRLAITRAVKKANKKILEDAKEMGIDNPVLVPHWHPNQLRHSAATMIRRDYGLEAAQVILGHSKADVTQIYAERDSAKAIEVVKQIG
jgi:integrase